MESQAEIVVGPMLRYVGTTTATVWLETSRPCVVTVLGHSTTTFHVEGHHYALVVVGGLEPGTTRPYEVTSTESASGPWTASARVP